MPIYATTENEAQVPGQAEFDDEFKNQVFENLKRGRIHRSLWRVEAREDYDFYAGRQWDEVDASRLNEQGRPTVVFNRIVRTINSVNGLEIQNRQEVRYYPRQMNGNPDPQTGTNDTGFADIMNQAAKWVRDQSNFEDEESESFNDCLISGEGWTEMRMDYEVEPEGMIIKNRVDPLEMLVDPNAYKKNFDDAKWIARVRDYTIHEIKAMFPDFDGVGGGTFWNDLEGVPHDADDAWMYKNDQSDQLTEPGKYSVIHYQYYEVVNVYLAIDKQTQQIHSFDEAKYNRNKEIIDSLSAKVVKSKQRKYKQCFIVGYQFFDHTELKCNEYTFKCVTGLRDRNKNKWFGLVALMKDPQRWANKWLSQIQHIINASAKRAILIEAGAVKDRRNLEDNLAQPGAIIDLNPGGLQKLDTMDAPNTPEGVDRLLNYAVNAINDVPGVNLELIGMADRNQPLGLELQRKSAGVTVLAVFFDALRRYRKNDGRLLASYIRDYISDGRLVRITGQQGVAYIPLVKDKLAFQYDIVVDDAPTSPNSKEKNFLILSQIVPMVMQAGIPVPPDILDYAPLPEDLIQKWKQTIMQQSQPDPMAEQMKQIQMVLAQLEPVQKQAEIEKLASESMKNKAAAEKDIGVGQEQQALAAQKFGLANNEQAMKTSNMIADQNRKDMELQLNHYRKMLEIALENKLKQQQMNAAPSLNDIR